MIDPVLVATQGAGPDPLAFATDGFIAMAVQPPVVVVPPVVRPRPPSVVFGGGAAVGGGGGGGGIARDVLGRRFRPWVPPEVEADLGIIHPPAVAARIKALADGVVEAFVDGKGRRGLVLHADDGTRYWYADVGEVAVEDGTRVSVGALIGKTKQGGPTVPQVLEPGVAPRELPAPGQAPPRKPIQPVFVEPPPPPAEPPKQLVRLVRLVRLVPIAPKPEVMLGEAVVAPARTAPAAGVVIAISAVALAATVIAIMARRQPARRARGRRKRKRRHG